MEPDLTGHMMCVDVLGSWPQSALRPALICSDIPHQLLPCHLRPKYSPPPQKINSYWSPLKQLYGAAQQAGLEFGALRLMQGDTQALLTMTNRLLAPPAAHTGHHTVSPITSTSPTGHILVSVTVVAMAVIPCGDPGSLCRLPWDLGMVCRGNEGNLHSRNRHIDPLTLEGCS